MSFSNLKLIEPILNAVKDEGYVTPTPIQLRAIPLILERRDILGCAQTGTGKTAAFAMPIIQLLSEDRRPVNGRRPIRSLILTPTRELAIQIGESFATYGKNTSLKYKVIFGGVNQSGQVDALRTGIDVLVATPGRLLDLMNQNYVKLDTIQYFVLDEADRMLDMGFLHDVKRVIAKLPARRQSLFFSATMPPAIIQLAGTILTNPARVEVTPSSTTVSIVDQKVYFVDKENKKHLLNEVLTDKSIERALVFTRTKHGADKVAKELIRSGVKAQAIHANKSQNARQTALNNFKTKLTRVLVATDIAARGIDIDDLTHVINYDLPNIPESYVHRIGRTGRAGASGTAIAFCDAEEKEYLRDIQKLTGKQIDIIENINFPLLNNTVVKAPPRGPRPSRGNAPGRSQTKPGASPGSHETNQTGKSKRSFSYKGKSNSWGKDRRPKRG
jgi:ATP-dependent RNA helicase RhlE